MQWKVGKVRITKVVELETVGSTRFILPLASNEEIQKLPWLIPHFATDEGRLKMSIHSLVLETPRHRIVVDTGLGNDKQGRNVPTWNNRNEPFLEKLSAAGFPPDSIDTCCARICMSTMSAGTRSSSAANGCRPSPRPATYSAKASMNIGATTASSPRMSPYSTIP